MKNHSNIKNYHKKGAHYVCNDSGKRCYSRLDAMIALANCSRSKSNARNEQRQYRCPKCGWYHLSSQAKYVSK
jgi:predicted RNA-binding Zn-ribbon protein involved in translation (DUF1610 family)